MSADLKNQSPASRSAFSLILPVALGSLVGIFGLQFILSMDSKPQAFDELALGSQTTICWSEIESNPIHCGMRDNTFQACVNAYKRNGRNRDVVLWLGNSQLHAINQFSKGDKNASFYLHQLLSDKNRYLFTISIPNANLQEHLFLAEYAWHHLPVKTIVLPLVFDDTRESGVREDLHVAIKLPAVKNRIAQTDIGQKLIQQCEASIVCEDSLQPQEKTLQQYSEDFLSGKLARHSKIWSSRPDLRGKFFVSLYRLRNYLLGIDASSKRRIIRGSYIANLEALKALVDSARQSDIEVLTYIAPIRDDVPIPYDQNEYSGFKQETRSITRKAGGTFFNLEQLVPNENWGTKESTRIAGAPEIDFMHFQAEGHVRLANAIDEGLRTIWSNSY